MGYRGPAQDIVTAPSNQKALLKLLIKKGHFDTKDIASEDVFALVEKPDLLKALLTRLDSNQKQLSRLDWQTILEYLLSRGHEKSARKILDASIKRGSPLAIR